MPGDQSHCIATENPEGKRGVGRLQGGSGQQMVCAVLIGTKITALMETAGGVTHLLKDFLTERTPVEVPG